MLKDARKPPVMKAAGRVKPAVTITRTFVTGHGPKPSHSGVHEDITPTFRRNISPASSGSRNKPSKRQKVLLLTIRFHSGFLLGLFFDPEDVGDMFL
jgi:hypothetical protein